MASRESDIAWAAGLFEGEGCIGIWWPPSTIGHRKQPQIRLQVTMTDRDVIEEFCRIVQCGSVSREQNRKPPRKNCWYWTIGNRVDVERLLRAFYPRLGERRRAKADEALAEIAKSVRACETCGETFRAQKSQRRFCSTSCQQRSYYVRHGNVPVAARSTA